MCGCWMRDGLPLRVIRSQLEEKLAVKCDRNCLMTQVCPPVSVPRPTGALVYDSIENIGDRRKEFLAGYRRFVR